MGGSRVERKAEFVERIKSNKRYENDTLVYRYRGYEYTIEDIPPYKRPAWYFQDAHSCEQSRIDRIIEMKQNEIKESKYENTAEYGFELFWGAVED